MGLPGYHLFNRATQRSPRREEFTSSTLQATPSPECIPTVSPQRTKERPHDANRQYFKFPRLIQGYPVLLRIYWLPRLPAWSTLNRTFGVKLLPAVQVDSRVDQVVNVEPAGLVLAGTFRSIIQGGQSLPQIERKVVRTTRDNQQAISVTPAVRRSEDQVQSFSKLRLAVAPAPKESAWMEFTFRVDVDGRYTLLARDPLHQMKIAYLVLVQ